ncbi:MAG: aldehyde dehydrogenase family protein [Actinomycetes bacterium]
MDTTALETLTAGTPIPFGGDRVTFVDEALAAAFRPGDALLVLQDDGTLLHLPAEDRARGREAVDRATDAFAAMGEVSDAAVTAFYEAFARRLEDDTTFAPVAAANAEDVARARERGRSTTRLELTARMRADMVAGLRVWRDAPAGRGSVVEEIVHDGWRLEAVRDGLGVIGFVFEGRPNVFADACGVLRGGNTVVFRIGSDALGTARAIVEHALGPALEEAGLPSGAASLVDSPAHAAGWAMFADPRLALAVARGSGTAVHQLGSVARQAGNPVSLHGTGGAWLVGAADADVEAFALAVEHSLDRKVCNTLNTCCVVRSAADVLVPAFLSALERAAGRRGVEPKLWVRAGDEAVLPGGWLGEEVQVARAGGPVTEPRAELLDGDALGREWEWEDSPEVTLVVVDDVDEAVALFNAQSPRFVASLVSEDEAAHRRFFERVDAPYVGNGFTRWVDGQYALDRPELGLANWEHGRLLGRSGILSGDSAFTVRLRAVQSDPAVRR